MLTVTFLARVDVCLDSSIYGAVGLTSGTLDAVHR